MGLGILFCRDTLVWNNFSLLLLGMLTHSSRFVFMSRQIQGRVEPISDATLRVGRCLIMDATGFNNLRFVAWAPLCYECVVRISCSGSSVADFGA